MVSPTHYDTLEVTESASEEVIKGAYRFLSQKWHPDKNSSQREKAERIMQAINDAYAVLSNPARRREYDAWLTTQRADRGASGGAEPKPAPPVSDRDEYIKAITKISIEPVVAILFFTLSAAFVVLAGFSDDLRETLFRKHIVQLGMALLLANAGIQYVLSSRMKRRLADNETSVLAHIYAQYERKKNPHIAITWLWIFLALTVLISYRHSLPNSAPSLVSEQPAPLVVHNDCNRALIISINYLTANDQWRTEGTYQLEPGKSSHLVLDAARGDVVQSASGLFYYYAVSTDGRFQWAGDENNPDHKSVTVGERRLRFRNAQLQRNDQDRYVLSLTCASNG